MGIYTIQVKDQTGKEQKLQGSNENLLQILRQAGVFIDAPCGGGGRCGKCRIKASGNLTPPSPEEMKLLTAEELKSGTRLACMTYATGDAFVAVEGTGDKMIIATTGKTADFVLAPSVYGVSVVLGEAHIGRQIDLSANLLEALAEAGHPADGLTLRAARKLGGLTRANNAPLFAVLSEKKVIDLLDRPILLYGCAVDIGTTTVVVYLYNLADGKLCGLKNGISAQRPFGADVISRIEASIEAGGSKPLQAAIVGQLNEMITALCTECGLSFEQVVCVTIAGNSTMQHFFAGLDAEKIAAAPFIQTSSFGVSYTAEELGLSLNPDGQVYILPSVSAYVGGDITAGVLACSLHKENRRCLLIDIGTNGEMALGNKDGVLYCSTAAGPAFEGAHIEDGMGGIDGAISVVTEENGRIAFKTIGGKPAIGICGSGIVDAAAVMLKIGAIDETGRLCDEDEIPAEYADRLVNDKFMIDKANAIGLTGKDIREIQLAKAAIAGGIATLLHYAGLKVEQLDVVFLAGGFGSYINKESACAIGLLPKELLDKIEVVGNSAGMGAGIALLSTAARSELCDIKTNGRYVELSADPYFQDAYVDSMMF